MNKYKKFRKNKSWFEECKEKLKKKEKSICHKVKAKRSLGQNFLHDDSISANICKNVDIKNKIVIEIGPGTGFLTKEILKNEPKKLILIEKDTRLFQLLIETFDKEIKCGKIEILNEDALKLNISEFAKNIKEFNENDDENQVIHKITIIANLPYNIGTTLVINWLEWLENIDNIIVMLQKEVVDRICAVPKTKDYGRISVLIQSLCDTKKLFDVKPECFTPKPKVTSSVVNIIPKKHCSLYSDVSFKQKLNEICKIAFCQRRKKLSNVFKKYEFIKIFPSKILEKRAEELSVDEYIQLAEQCR